MPMEIIELQGITKRFGNTVANDNIDFTLKRGEIHALLGENGAGKSTLMNILAGRYRPDSGKIFVDGGEVQFKSPRDAINNGIGMIHQHFMLVQAHTVLDNIILSMPSNIGLLLNRKKLAQDISTFCEQHHFTLNLDARIWQLSVGEQQWVEIVKTLYRGAHILILDEPTSVLTPQESAELFQVLQSMKQDGYSIIFISHKLDEVLAISDRITILRKGKVVDTMPNTGIQKRYLARLMVAEVAETVAEVAETSGPEFWRIRLHHTEHTREILTVEGVTAKNDKQLIALNDISITVHAGEIVGIAGVAGNGQTELAEVIAGMRRIESGDIYIDGVNIRHQTIKEIIDLGVAYIPEDRVGVASVSSLNIPDNILLKCYDVFSYSRKTAINEYSRNLTQKYDVVYSVLSAPVRHLSGGNLQKLILARELREIPKLLIAVYPTRGLDVSAVEYVRNVLIECRNNGSAILLISEDLDELLLLSNRIAVMYEGTLTLMETHDVEAIGLAMVGGKEG